jgi:hypothetical protein
MLLNDSHYHTDLVKIAQFVLSFSTPTSQLTHRQWNAIHMAEKSPSRTPVLLQIPSRLTPAIQSQFPALGVVSRLQLTTLRARSSFAAKMNGNCGYESLPRTYRPKRYHRPLLGLLSHYMKTMISILECDRYNRQLLTSGHRVKSSQRVHYV